MGTLAAIIGAVAILFAILTARRRGLKTRHALVMLAGLILVLGGIGAASKGAPSAATTTTTAASSPTDAPMSAQALAPIGAPTLATLQRDMAKIQGGFNSVVDGSTGWRVEGSDARASLVAGEVAIKSGTNAVLYDIGAVPTAQAPLLAPVGAATRSMAALEQQISIDSGTPDTTTFSGTAAVSADVVRLKASDATFMRDLSVVAQAAGDPISAPLTLMAPHSTVMTNATWDEVVADPTEHVGDPVDVVLVWGPIIADSGEPAYYAAFLPGEPNLYHEVAVMDPSAFQAPPDRGATVRIIGTVDGTATLTNAFGASVVAPEVAPTSVSPASVTPSATSSD